MPLELGLVRGTPSIMTAPESGWSKPAIMFISVDLPQPGGPDDGDELAVGDREADIVDDRQRPLVGREALASVP